MKELEGIEISERPDDLVCYGYDASGYDHRPRYVAWPTSTEDVSRILRYASEHGIPIVPRGAGTGMTAGSVPVEGSIALSFERMTRILAMDVDNLTVQVEPGIVNADLQAELLPHGLFYPPDPASLKTCTIGGNVAENAGGPSALKYGVTRDYVMGLEAVLPSGEVITTGVKTHKGVVGYDLTRLLVGSEGTLAAITKVRLKTMPVPEHVETMLAIFRELEPAGRAVVEITRAKVIPRTLEIMDKKAIELIEDFKPAGLPVGAEAVLLIEMDGHREAVMSEAERVGEVCRKLGAEVRTAKDAAERERLWEARRAVSPALHKMDMKKINEDVVVPRDRLPEMLVWLAERSAATGVPIVNFGHAGDGNIHVNIMASKEDPAQAERAEALVHEMFEKVLTLGGTISGEHGVGLTKAPYIVMEVGERELEIMRQVKDVFDPGGIMNPGKVFTIR
jgi:glycolate oxidase